MIPIKKPLKLNKLLINQEKLEFLILSHLSQLIQLKQSFNKKKQNY